VGELVGQRGLAQLLEDRAVRLRLERVLDELLLDRGGALYTALVADVGQERAADPAQVDAAVGVEALVLDRDGGLLDDRRDLPRRHDHAVVLAQDADRVTEVVGQQRLLVAVEREACKRGQVRDDEMNTRKTNETRPSSSTSRGSRPAGSA
jgi:hypothetical protein